MGVVWRETVWMERSLSKVRKVERQRLKYKERKRYEESEIWKRNNGWISADPWDAPFWVFVCCPLGQVPLQDGFPLCCTFPLAPLSPSLAFKVPRRYASLLLQALPFQELLTLVLA